MPSSKVIILAIIASLNAVWGYPLVGLLASMLTLLVVCAFANWLLRPRLSAAMRMPEIVAANSQFDARISIENLSSTPVFDLAISLTELPPGWHVRPGTLFHNDRPSISQLNARESSDVSYTLQVDGRGEYQWPALRCESTFPFSLFRSRQDIHFGQSKTSRGGRTWVTPAIIGSDMLEFVQTMLSRGQHADGIRTGDSLDYSGSREYTYGDYVRRWDFASWARLGRPIVRQFDQSSTGNVTIVVDTFLDSKATASDDDAFESRLSHAASIIHSLKHTLCRIDLIFPKEDGIESVNADQSMQETLLRPLATAIGIRSLRNSSGPLFQKNGWSKVGSMLEPNHTLICIMRPVNEFAENRYTQARDRERREFLELVESFPVSTIIAPLGKRKVPGVV